MNSRAVIALIAANAQATADFITSLEVPDTSSLCNIALERWIVFRMHSDDNHLSADRYRMHNYAVLMGESTDGEGLDFEIRTRDRVAIRQGDIHEGDIFVKWANLDAGGDIDKLTASLKRKQQREQRRRKLAQEAHELAALARLTEKHGSDSFSCGRLRPVAWPQEQT